MSEIVEWSPDRKSAIILNVAGLILTVAAGYAFAALWAFTHLTPGEAITFTLGAHDLLGFVATVVAIVLLMVIHELLHGLALRALGHRPAYGFVMMGKVMPALFTTAPGAQMSRAAFTFVALLPMVVLALVPALWIVAGPGGGWLVVPAAVLLGGCVGDLALTWQAWRSPRGTAVEDMKDGLRLHLPT